jgi:hypothetical protein
MPEKYFSPMQVNDGEHTIHRSMSGVWNAVHPVETVESRPLWSLNRMEVENTFQNYHAFMQRWVSANVCHECNEYTAGKVCHCENDE